MGLVLLWWQERFLDIEIHAVKTFAQETCTLMVNIVLLAACSTLIGDFYGAIVANDIAAVRELLEQGQDPNEPQDGIHSPFEYAKTVEMFDLLIEYGALPDRPDAQGKTAIWYAETADILQHLLETGVDPDRVKVSHRTLLETLCDHYCSYPGKRTKEKIDLLRSKGAKYTVRCIISLNDLSGFEQLETNIFDQQTLDELFIHAIKSKRVIISYLLLKTGANPNHEPLLLFDALESGELTALLLDHGADIAKEFDMRRFASSGPPVADRFQAIHRASSDPTYLEGLAVLLERGADPNARDSEGETPLFWSIRKEERVRKNSMLRTITTLLGSGALNDIPNKQGETPVSLVETLKVSEDIRSQVQSKHFASTTEKKSCILESPPKD